jgi:hypothetical protein
MQELTNYNFWAKKASNFIIFELRVTDSNIL